MVWPITLTPYQDHFCLVATTLGVGAQKRPTAPQEADIHSVLERLQRHFQHRLTRESVLRAYTVQQPVYSDDCRSKADGVDDYALDLDGRDGRSPLIAVFGGSFATHHGMAQEAVEMLGQYLSLTTAAPPSAESPHSTLPGSALDASGFDQFILGIATQYPWLPSHLLQHYCQTYGARCRALLGDARSLNDPGPELSPGLLTRDAAVLVENEWGTWADDILWRRTRLGLKASLDDAQQLDDWLATQFPSLLHSLSARLGGTISPSTASPRILGRT